MDKRQARQFQCNNGNLINKDQRCDGTHDCADSSDETSTLCHDNECLPNELKCDYGACVQDLANCGTTTNEYGRSRFSHTPYRPPNAQYTGGSATCQVLKIPTNGNAESVARPGVFLTIGDRVAHDSVIIYRCTDNRRLIGERSNKCVNGRWKASVPQCIGNGMIVG